jgi:acyl-coenzyme A synthetase/AMP-(fatty) acid ligase
MKIILNQQTVDLTQQCRWAKKQLQDNQVYTLCSNDYLDHVAAYLVWLNQGGNIFVKAPGLPPEQDQHVAHCLSQQTLQNAIIFHTSGTTGFPKLVINHRQQIEQAWQMSTEALGWSNQTNFLTFVPPYTTGFWHIILPAAVAHNSTLTIGSKEHAAKHLNDSGCNATILVPGLINRLRSLSTPVDLSTYHVVGVGASQVNQTHVNYVFDRGAQKFAHLYGASEIASPLLSRATTSRNDNNEWLNLPCHGQNQIKFVENELWVSGTSVCSNYQEFEHQDQWIKTGDLWEQDGELVRFMGRSNDIVKMNGFKTNLTFVETVLEERTNLGECMAVLRHTAGFDWLEVLYTNSQALPNYKQMAPRLNSVLSKCNIPKKYTWVEHIPKNPLGKKLRHV